MRHLLVSIGFVLVLTPVGVSAETVVRSGDSVSLAAEQQVADDFYAAATTFVQSGSVAGDVYAAAGTVTVNGEVGADITALAGRVDVSGDVGDDVRVIAGEVIISGAVAGDIFVFGGTLNILSTATIAGDVYMFGGEADIAGDIAGSIFGRVEQMRVDAPVGGAIDVTARQGLTLGVRADIAGDIQLQSTRTLVRAPEAIVNGDILTQEMALVESDRTLSDRILPTLMMLFGSLVLYLLGRQFMAAVVTTAVTRVLRSSLIGAAVFIVGPVLAVMLLATVLGLVVGLGALGLFIAVVALSYSIAPMVLGAWLWPLLGGSRELHPFAILTGVLCIQVLFLVPYVGPAVVVGLSVLAAGALVDTAGRRLVVE